MTRLELINKLSEISGDVPVMCNGFQIMDALRESFPIDINGGPLVVGTVIKLKTPSVLSDE